MKIAVLGSAAKPFRLACCCLAFLSMCGCSVPDLSPTGETMPDDQGRGFQPSGFLSDYSKLAPSTQVETEGAYVYRNKAKQLSVYKLVILEPVKVHLRPGAAGRKQSPEALQELANYFEARLRDKLGNSFPLVDNPGFGVMRIRAAIVDATPNMPISKGFDAPAFVGSAGIELEILDSVSGVQLGAIVDSRPGEWRGRNLLDDNGNVKDLLNNWATYLRYSLDDSRGLHRELEFRRPGKWTWAGDGD